MLSTLQSSVLSNIHCIIHCTVNLFVGKQVECTVQNIVYAHCCALYSVHYKLQETGRLVLYFLPSSLTSVYSIVYSSVYILVHYNVDSILYSKVYIRGCSSIT